MPLPRAAHDSQAHCLPVLDGSSPGVPAHPTPQLPHGSCSRPRGRMSSRNSTLPGFPVLEALKEEGRGATSSGTLARSENLSSCCPPGHVGHSLITSEEESSESSGLGRLLLLRQHHSHLLTGAYGDGSRRVWPERAKRVAAQGGAPRRFFTSWPPEGLSPCCPLSGSGGRRAYTQIHSPGPDLGLSSRDREELTSGGLMMPEKCFLRMALAFVES